MGISRGVTVPCLGHHRLWQAQCHYGWVPAWWWYHPGSELQLPTLCTPVASPPMPISPFLSSWLLLGAYLLQEKIRPHGSRDFKCKKRVISDDVDTYNEIQIFRQASIIYPCLNSSWLQWHRWFSSTAVILFQNTNCIDCHISHLSKIILPWWTCLIKCRALTCACTWSSQPIIDEYLVRDSGAGCVIVSIFGLCDDDNL
jgi:hypothetical protein